MGHSSSSQKGGEETRWTLAQRAERRSHALYLVNNIYGTSTVYQALWDTRGRKSNFLGPRNPETGIRRQDKVLERLSQRVDARCRRGRCQVDTGQGIFQGQKTTQAKALSPNPTQPTT